MPVMDGHAVAKSWYLRLQQMVASNPLSDYTWFIEQEVNTWADWTPMPLRQRIWLWRRGFTSPCARLYDFSEHDPASYLSELQRYRFYRAINGSHRYRLDDKLSQHWMLADHAPHRPRAFGLINEGHVHGMAGTCFDGSPRAVADWLPDVLAEESELVLRHVRGHGGSEVIRCSYDGEFHLDGAPVSEAELIEVVSQLSGYLVSEFVDQHAYASAIYPRATNTIRVLTIWDRDRSVPYVPIAVHRIGTDLSQPVDNFSQGGLSSRVELDTGTLGPAARVEPGRDLTWYDHHPDTDASITDTTIPGWARIIETIETIACQASDIPVIGWDVLLDADAVPRILEANTGPDIDLLQLHQPLLTDDRMAVMVQRTLGR